MEFLIPNEIVGQVKKRKSKTFIFKADLVKVD